MKYYASQNSCLLGITKNRWVIALIIARRFGEINTVMPLIRPRHLRALIKKELGVFHKQGVQNCTDLVLNKIEEKFTEDFIVIHNYAMELKATNPWV